MLVADTSAWIEFLKGTGSTPARRLQQAISQREVIVIDPILLEVMAGARRDAVARTKRLLEERSTSRLCSPSLIGSMPQ